MAAVRVHVTWQLMLCLRCAYRILADTFAAGMKYKQWHLYVYMQPLEEAPFYNCTPLTND